MLLEQVVTSDPTPSTASSATFKGKPKLDANGPIACKRWVTSESLSALASALLRDAAATVVVPFAESWSVASGEDMIPATVGAPTVLPVASSSSFTGAAVDSAVGAKEGGAFLFWSRSSSSPSLEAFSSFMVFVLSTTYYS